ncbi:MAG TPA: UbiD family decarboxylase [Chloroflexota bacterium]|nr:UbiD family decarboxylase [Chloroflexota bacterium]
MPKDLSSFINRICAEFPDQVVTVRRPIDPNAFEVTAILQHLDDRGQYPMALFEQPLNLLGEPAEFPLVSNIFGTRERCALALDMPPEQCKLPLSLEYARREREQIPPVVIDRAEAPVKQVVLRGEEVDIRRLPIVRHFEGDLSAVITMAAVMKDPDTGVYDVSFVKGFPKGARKAGVSIHSPHLERILAKYEQRGEPAPYVHILGHHPAFFLGALALTPYDSDDYATIGSFLGEPLRLVPSETWGEKFLVPADAELLIEGEIPPGERTVVDPFGEVTRLYQAQCLRPVLNVTALTYRRGAWYQDIFSGHQGHWNLGAIPKEGSLYNALQKRFGNIEAVHLPYSGCGRLACYISIHKTREGQGKEVAIAALPESWTFEVIIVVDADIDVFNERDVLWAVYTYMDPLRDLDIIHNFTKNVFTSAFQGQRILIDATRPLDVAFPEKFRMPPEVMQRIKLDEWIEWGARPARERQPVSRSEV